MKQMIFGLLALLLTACSNKKEVIASSATMPTLSFSKDTVHVREQDWTNVQATGNGRLTIYVKEAAHTMNLQIEDTSTRVHLLYRGIEIRSGESLPVMDSVQLFCVADAPGLYAVDTWLTDRLGRSALQKIYLRAFPGSSPIASFFYRDMGSDALQSWNYVLDASGAKSPDGLIQEYHYSIGGQAVVSNQPVLNWTFHAKGDHQVGLYVVDDLGHASAVFTQTITIL